MGEITCLLLVDTPNKKPPFIPPLYKGGKCEAWGLYSI